MTRRIRPNLKLIGAVSDEKNKTELESAPQFRLLLHYKQPFLAERAVPKFENMCVFTLVDETRGVVIPPDFPFAERITVLKDCPFFT